MIIVGNDYRSLFGIEVRLGTESNCSCASAVAIQNSPFFIHFLIGQRTPTTMTSSYISLSKEYLCFFIFCPAVSITLVWMIYDLIPQAGTSALFDCVSKKLACKMSCSYLARQWHFLLPLPKSQCYFHT